MRLSLPQSSLIYLYARFYYAYKSKHEYIRKMLLVLVNIVGNKNFHILLADDDKDDREIFCEALHDVASQIKITTVNNGIELLRILENKDALPDIIFLDLNMPIKKGQECLEEIRRSARLKNIPVIIYSTSTSREHIEETYKLGANYYLPKPDSFKDLHIIFKKILSLDWGQSTQPSKDQFVLKANLLK